MEETIPSAAGVAPFATWIFGKEGKQCLQGAVAERCLIQSNKQLVTYLVLSFLWAGACILGWI